MQATCWSAGSSVWFLLGALVCVGAHPGRTHTRARPVTAKLPPTGVRPLPTRTRVERESLRLPQRPNAAWSILHLMSGLAPHYV